MLMLIIKIFWESVETALSILCLAITICKIIFDFYK